MVHFNYKPNEGQLNVHNLEKKGDPLASNHTQKWFKVRIMGRKKKDKRKEATHARCEQVIEGEGSLDTWVKWCQLQRVLYMATLHMVIVSLNSSAKIQFFSSQLIESNCTTWTDINRQGAVQLCVTIRACITTVTHAWLLCTSRAVMYMSGHFKIVKFGG